MQKLTGLAGNAAYVASQHACSGLTRNGAIDYAFYGTRINSVNMGCTKTMSLLAYANSKKRQATVWEQAAVICFLLSDEASNLTDGLFATDGGWTAY